MAITIKSEAVQKLFAERKNNIETFKQECDEKLKKFAESLVLTQLPKILTKDINEISSSIVVKFAVSEQKLYAALFPSCDSEKNLGTYTEFDEYYLLAYTNNDVGERVYEICFQTASETIKIPIEDMVFVFPLE